ncbi:histone deacetylase family protein [Sinimarinibacterium sp. CAU 1509]|uniref:histone deacetylase family protein n=1 Tax=Sinimarinibacterium sp. CAU 1509 TaxID=2562283 RepID=UPI0010AB7355|nr:histone deacetylase family protein [Sinimarinibacterium sp. CAU 1509]TJY62993.1 histone deacetylase family protein [Sinimarinibacterium sp. CAU 1509]
MRANLPVAWISHPVCSRHQIDEDHPESPQRLAAIEDRLLTSGLGDFVCRHEAPDATRDQLERVHESSYIDHVLRHRRIGDVRVVVDNDTAFNRYTVDAALRAAGAGVLGVDLVMRGEAGLAFCAVRPPGHHAERARTMGFCFFNNVAVAAAHALSYGLEHVAIIDFDLHYGNGTADIFKNDPRVLLLSTYQHPLYPYWTGVPDAINLIDVPLSPYTHGEAFRAAVLNEWMPALERTRPELILVSAGFDAHAADPMGDLRLQYEDYRWLGSLIKDLGESSAQNRIVATLEGGYDLTALARSVEAFLTPFLGGEMMPL